jgi:hypothetical protein
MATAEAAELSPELAALKDEGNGFFRAGEFLKAAGAYTKVIKVGREDFEAPSRYPAIASVPTLAVPSAAQPPPPPSAQPNRSHPPRHA